MNGLMFVALVEKDFITVVILFDMNGYIFRKIQTCLYSFKNRKQNVINNYNFLNKK